MTGRLRGLVVASGTAVAVLLAGRVASPSAASRPPAGCEIAGVGASVHVMVTARAGWHVQACVFDLVKHGRVMEQTGIEHSQSNKDAPALREQPGA